MKGEQDVGSSQTRMRGGIAASAEKTRILCPKIRQCQLWIRENGAAAGKTAQPGTGWSGNRVPGTESGAGFPGLSYRKIGGGAKTDR